MARLLTTGFETGDLSDVTAQTGASASTAQARTGTYSLFITGTSTTATLRGWSALTTIYFGFAFYRGYDNICCLMKGINATGTDIFSITRNAGGAIAIHSGGQSTLLGTTTNTASISAWHYIECYYYVADSSGRAVVILDGDQGGKVDFTGDTKLSSSTADITALKIAMQGSGSNIQAYFDDIVVNDDTGGANNSYPGVIKLEPIRPNAAGDNTGLSRGGTDSGSNYGQVDEVPASITDYVYDTVVDEYDLYNTTTITLPTGATVKNVVVVAVAQMDSGSGNLAVMTKNGTTTTTGSTQALGASLKTYEQAWNVNPDDSAAWEQADIDALQIGVKVK